MNRKYVYLPPICHPNLFYGGKYILFQGDINLFQVIKGSEKYVYNLNSHAFLLSSAKVFSQRV